ncbi:MAG: DUF3276 family protein [Bacteroidota bacterium]
MTTSKSEETSGATDSRFNQDVYSQVVRAGKRTYFFDVKCTRNDEYYLTITESKRRFEDSGQPVFEKHKIFLYREDFSRFIDSLQEVFSFIEEKQPDIPGRDEDQEISMDSAIADIQFEDLSS